MNSLLILNGNGLLVYSLAGGKFFDHLAGSEIALFSTISRFYLQRFHQQSLRHLVGSSGALQADMACVK